MWLRTTTRSSSWSLSRGADGSEAIDLHERADAPICGETTALMGLTDGERGEARFKPLAPPSEGP